MVVGAGFKPSQAGEEADNIAWREGIEWLRVELQAMTILRNAHKETCSCVAFHPRAWRLMHERKPFVVVANDEPYFPSVYGMIREREKEKECWTGVDEINYLKAMSEYGFQHPPQPAPDSK
jgi:hypothetical protein